MKTAVEWLLKQYVELGTLSKSIVEQAKAIEKEQIMAAWLMDGYTDISNDDNYAIDWALNEIGLQRVV